MSGGQTTPRGKLPFAARAMLTPQEIQESGGEKTRARVFCPRAVAASPLAPDGAADDRWAPGGAVHEIHPESTCGGGSGNSAVPARECRPGFQTPAEGRATGLDPSCGPSRQMTAPERATSSPPAPVFFDPATMILLSAMATHDEVSVERLVLEMAGERARRTGHSALARWVLDHHERKHSRAPP